MYLFFCFLPPYLAHSSKQYLRTMLLNFYLDRTYLFLFSDKVMGLVFVTFWCVSPTILILFTLHFYNINIPFIFNYIRCFGFIFPTAVCLQHRRVRQVEVSDQGSVQSPFLSCWALILF